ncbi:hypothetical protein WMY93_021722 [Mugilogobius chulae]|uniref:Phospholipase A2 n=1 Tax=Mugilogobius chulae TaxID=88201 RepID=A0AAW0NGF4_9GOBI
MKAVAVLCLLALSLDLSNSLDYRALNQFRNMILCLLPDSWPLLDYADYGCYCGKGGSGTPVDELDKCCQVHDQCYSDAMQHDDCWPVFDNPYTEIYSYSCDESQRKLSCLSDNNACEMFICECDRLAAECFARSPWNQSTSTCPATSASEPAPADATGPHMTGAIEPITSFRGWKNL